MLPQIRGWISLSDLAIVVIPIIVSSLITGAVFLWQPSEADYRRKEEIWKAIEAWVEMPIVEFRHQYDTLPLGEKPPKLGVDVEKCLERNYPSVWSGLKKFRQEYSEWKNEDVSKRFSECIDGVLTMHIGPEQTYNELMCRQLIQCHNQLAEQIKSEILGKHCTELKC